jgi:hypothetical protein
MTARADEAHIGLVVEGRGEQQAVPLLLRAHLVAAEIFQDILSAPVVCHGREKALMDGGIEGFVATAAARPGCGGILVLLDGEGDAVCTLGPGLLGRAQQVTNKPLFVCLADPKFEAWLIASAETLELDHLTYDSSRDPAALVRGALPGKYIKPTWQPRLTARMDIGLAAGRNESLAPGT